jgi:DNA-directed RNA polymerase subunit RPC12/RpoP
MGFWKHQMELLKADANRIANEEAAKKTRNANGEIRCPKCGSTQITANKKGFGVGKAVVGAVTVGAVGVAAGLIGKNQVEVTCLACGHKWKVGK